MLLPQPGLQSLVQGDNYLGALFTVPGLSPFPLALSGVGGLLWMSDWGRNLAGEGA